MFLTNHNPTNQMPPFQSEAQRKYLWANEPEIAKAWAHGRSSKTGRKEKKRKKRIVPRKSKDGFY